MVAGPGAEGSLVPTASLLTLLEARPSSSRRWLESFSSEARLDSRKMVVGKALG